MFVLGIPYTFLPNFINTSSAGYFARYQLSTTHNTTSAYLMAKWCCVNFLAYFIYLIDVVKNKVFYKNKFIWLKYSNAHFHRSPSLGWTEGSRGSSKISTYTYHLSIYIVPG